MFLIVCDIHRNILSVQSFVRYKTNNSVDNIHIIVRSDCLTLCLYSKSSLKRQITILLPEKNFIPSSVSSVIYQNSAINVIFDKEENISEWSCCLPTSEQPEVRNETVFDISFRIQISSPLGNCFSNANIFKKFKDFIEETYQNCNFFHLVCTECENVLNEKTTNFQIIKTYDERTSELAENWFCHKHDDDSLLHLKENAFYVGDVYFYFHNSFIKDLNILKTDKGYNCKSCMSVLSMNEAIFCSEFTGFYCDKVLLQNSKFCESLLKDTKKYKKNIALYSFLSVLSDILDSSESCKIYIQNKVHKEESLLLWINSQKGVQFLYCVENDEDIPNEIEFKTKEVFKILYNIVSSTSELAVKWQRDFYVEFLPVSDNMMKVICNLLKESSNYFSSSKVDEFSIGYLPTDFDPNTL